MASAPLAAAPPGGHRSQLLELTDRILRMSLNDQVAAILSPSDVEQLQFRCQEAVQTLAITDDGSNAATPALCSLAMHCVCAVERCELSTGAARLVSAGFEIFAALLEARQGDTSEDVSAYTWIEDSLGDLSDILDFLALEVYCGLSRLDGLVLESDALPVVLDPGEDCFGSFWGSIEHRLALQDLSAWLFCVIFRALSFEAVNAKTLMEFANYDVLCLSTLLRGLLATRREDRGLPDDAEELRRLGLRILCGLTAPELAFPCAVRGGSIDGNDGVGGDIQRHNRVLQFYIEVLCAAVVETGLLGAALTSALALAENGRSDSATMSSELLCFLGALMPDIQDQERAMTEGQTEDDDSDPGPRLCNEICKRADMLSRLLEAALQPQRARPAQGANAASVAGLRDLVGACACLSAALVTRAGGFASIEDGFLLSCRMLLEACLDAQVEVDELAGITRAAACGVANGPGLLAGLVALAANMGDLEALSPRFRELVATMSPQDRAQALSRLTLEGRRKLPVLGSREAARSIFDDSPGSAPAAAAPPAAPEAVAAASPPAAAAATGAEAGASDSTGRGRVGSGLRDLIAHVPSEFRCALDGKLLCDAVVSPAGVHFERSTLLKWLQSHGEVCPVTGSVLRMEDCQRSSELRQSVAAWVRAQRGNPGGSRRAPR